MGRIQRRAPRRCAAAAWDRPPYHCTPDNTGRARCPQRAVPLTCQWHFDRVLFYRDGAAGLFLGGVVGFVGEHALFGAAAAPAFLAADFLDTGALGIDVTFLERFDLVEQEPAGEEAVECLLARGLAFDPQTGRTVEQHHAGGGLVDVLAAVTARPDKGLFEVGVAHAERGHALRELGFLFGADGKRAHAGSVAGKRRKGNGSVGVLFADASLQVNRAGCIGLVGLMKALVSD